MTEIEWRNRPRLEQPVILAAFEGWNDAGVAASTALDHLSEHWNCQPLADIDPEIFYDFTVTRPVVMNAGPLREIVWPQNEFSYISLPDGPDIIILRATEPQLRWRTYAQQILDVANQYNARLILTLGALLADVPHTRPTPIYGTAYADHVIEALHLEPSSYEGPTGIVGVVHDAAIREERNSASLWAAVPSYVSAAPSAKATLALVMKTCHLLGVPAPLGTLETEVAQYEDQITQLVAEDRETAEYIYELEISHDRDNEAVDNADALVDEVERYLRDL